MKINGYEIALSEEELDKIINEQTQPIELISKDFKGYEELSEGDKKALQHLVNAGKMMTDVAQEQDHPLNKAMRTALEEAAKNSTYAAKALKLFTSFSGVEGLNGIDPKPIEIFKGIHGSKGRNFYPQDLKDMTDLEEWMYPVIQRAVRDGVVAPSRLGEGKDLFAACKAWNINPKMPKAIAEQVGEMSLAKRMIAGAIVDDMARAQIKTLKENNPDNYVIQGASWISEDSSYFANVKAGMNHNKELIPEFWKEMSKAQEMSFGEAMKTYIPNTPINRKRFVAAMLEEMGVENTEAKYQQTYKNLEENGKFEEFLASDSKEQKLERIKQNKAKVQEKSTKKKSIREAIRERLAKKNIIPETGAFGEGHKITANKDMSQFKAFVDKKSR